MTRILFSVILIVNFLHAYTDKDWEVYNACKAKVYDYNTPKCQDNFF